MTPVCIYTYIYETYSLYELHGHQWEFNVLFSFRCVLKPVWSNVLHTENAITNNSPSCVHGSYKLEYHPALSQPVSDWVKKTKIRSKAP